MGSSTDRTGEVDDPDERSSATSDEEARLSVLAEPTRDRTGRDFISYMHTVLCQVGLPRRRVEGRRFERTHKGASLLVQAGELWDGKQWIPQPLPYGPKPRVMLADLLTFAVVHRTRTIPLENSVTQYLARLGWTNQGGARGPLTAFRNQAKALSACHLTLGVSYGSNAHTIEGKPFRRFSAWTEDRDGQRCLWPSELELTTDFYESLLNHAVPLDGEALRKLSGSALSLDVYCWLAYRLHQLKNNLFLPWKPLREQFGQEYRDPRDFKREFLPAFKEALSVYPAAARSQQVRGGIVLQPAAPPIRRTTVLNRDIQRQMAAQKKAGGEPQALADEASLTPDVA